LFSCFGRLKSDFQGRTFVKDAAVDGSSTIGRSLAMAWRAAAKTFVGALMDLRSD
jgi:hypothetical protein